MSAEKDRVRVLLAEGGALANGVLQPQPHRKGVVTVDNGDGTRGVLFENGVFVDNIPDAALQVLDNVGNTLIDQTYLSVVRPAGADASQEYTGVVVDLFIAAASTRVLVRTLRGTLFYDQPLTQLVRVDAEGVPQ